MAEIFKAYDIRGIYPEDLNNELAYKIGRAFILFTKAKTVLIGRDMRSSSEDLFKNLSDGITDQGAEVIDINMCSTPMLYYASGSLQPDAAIMITASHNPGNYNGFKLSRKNLVPIGEEEIQEIKKLVQKNKFPESKKKGMIEEKDIYEDYKKWLLDKIKKFPFKVVIDTANSMGIKEAKIVQEITKETIPLFWQLADDFPNHLANPLEYETLKDLQKKVKETKADLGISYDGDADRVAFVDEKGDLIPMDLMIAVIASTYKDENILYDLRSSKIVPEIIEKSGNNPIKTRVGHTFIKKRMREENAVFAGEMSGHYYFRDRFYAESSTTAAIKLMQIMQKENKKLSEIIKPLRRYFQSGEINSEVEDKEGKIKELAEKYKDGKISYLDGITVEYKYWWFNVRLSNTEPVLRLNLEAGTKESMEKKRDEVLKIIRS